MLYHEELPKFNGGDPKLMTQWVKERQVYPQKTLKLGLEGRVTMQFTISEKGKLIEIHIMTLFSKIALSRRYGKAIYSISAVLTLALSSLAFFNPLAIPLCIMMKLISIPIILYLFMALTKKSEIFFYLNLGFSRKEYYAIPVIVEFIGCILFMIIITVLCHAIR